VDYPEGMHRDGRDLPLTRDWYDAHLGVVLVLATVPVAEMADRAAHRVELRT